MTADRLLDGAVAPDDAPPGYQDVTRALHATALVASETPTRDSTTAVAAFLDAIPSRRTTRMKKWKIAAATLAGGLTLSTGLAAADVLPAPAQDVASSALSRVGINVPDGDGSTTKVSTVKDEKKAKKADADPSTPTTKPEHPDNHGSVVSDAAHDKSNVGADHGSAVCTTASGGKCQSNETHGNNNNANAQNGNDNGANNEVHDGAQSGATGGSSGSSTGSSSSSGSTGSSSGSSGGSSSSSGSTSSGGSSSSGSSSNSSGSSSGG